MTNSNIDRYRTPVATGSLADIARATNQTLAESFLSCEAVIVVDVSGSMTIADVPNEGQAAAPHEDDKYNWGGIPGGLKRYDVACAELTKLQADIPGKVAVIAFSDHPEFCPGGYPRYIGGGTDMAQALTFIKIADNCGLRIILISDGAPNDPETTLRIASTFTSRIDTIYIGPANGSGADFLRQLAAASGGVATVNNVQGIKQLSGTVKLLMGR